MPSNARTVALRLLSRRERTTSELRAALVDREYRAEEIDEAIRSLTADGLLDDRRAAAEHIRLASSVKGRGRVRILRELAARGVDRALARELVADLQADDETAAIDRFLSRKRLPTRLGSADRRRVFQQLLRRGFPAETIARVLRTRSDSEGD